MRAGEDLVTNLRSMSPLPKARTYITYTEEVDVEIHLGELLDSLSDEELEEHGLGRLGEDQDGKWELVKEETTPLMDHIRSCAMTRRLETRAF